MDLISAHRHGLGDQLREEAEGLTGRPQDDVQRAIVAHHLFDHSAGRHAYALFAAEAALGFEEALDALRTAAKRARWRIGRNRSVELLERVEAFGAALAGIDAERCAAMWIAYRAAQHDATHAMVPAELAALHGGDARAIFAAHQAWFEGRWGLALEAAIVALDWPLRAAPVTALLEGLRIPATRLDKAERRGLRKAEAVLVADKRLPARFAANPAHHYYALQRAMAARRRDERCRFDEFPLEDSVRLAAAA